MAPGQEVNHVKVIDFGVAKLARAEGDATLTQAGWLGGTPAYMSPEACAGREVTLAGDVYSLGGVLYFLLTGAPPFTANSAPAAMQAHLQEAPAPPSQRLGAPVPEAMKRIVLRCLAKSPGERFQSMPELGAALGDFLAASPWTPERAREFWAGGRRSVEARPAALAVAQTEAGPRGAD